MPSVVCFGEVLWDVFPSHRKIGGAPLNVALRINSLGLETSIISRVGNDKEGKEIIDYIQRNGVNVWHIQQDKNLKTGLVYIELDQSGSASYTIEQPVAWDMIEIDDKTLSMVATAEAFIFGSLASRSRQSRATLLAFLEKASFKVFDINLRTPFYSQQLLQELMTRADFIKCNDEELLEVCNFFKGATGSIKEQIIFLSKQTQTEQICVTLGSKGAIFYFENKIYEHTGYPVQVEDTVGAGDSFLATLIEALLKKAEPGKALDRACAMGALVASRKGANPGISEKELRQFIRAAR